jgi:hypothetical protein
VHFGRLTFLQLKKHLAGKVPLISLPPVWIKRSSLNVDDYWMKCGEKRHQKLAGKYSHCIFAARLKKSRWVLHKTNWNSRQKLEKNLAIILVGNIRAITFALPF